jgi:hypothetical protein
LIGRKALLDDLKKLVTKLEKDLRERCEENVEINAQVRIEYEKAKEAKRTAQAYQIWRDGWITQVAVAWVLGVVFVRFIEDNGLIAAPFVAGPGARLEFAKEQRTAFFQRNPTQSDREYLEYVFREVAKLAAMKELYDERHNPLWALGVSGDGAKLFLEQFQKIDPGTGTLLHDFTDPEWNTRFLGDLYQDLSEAARKKYALLQTPEFVEEFILDRTLDPAIAEFGLEAVRMIDPTCGSGHFLLGAFARLFRRWEEREPATNRTVLAQRALDEVYGVDLNPYAVAISRFRLLVAAMKASGVKRLKDAPAFALNLATGDSLLHGPRFAATGGVQRHLDPADDPLRHVYMTEDADALRRILGQQYHAVVGNPPYITVKDKALKEAYRHRYGSCSGKYSLSVPFMERFFELALAKNDGHSAGFVGQITANSFMKREFGAKLIEKFIPTWDLTHVIDTSRAHIPEHGTPTVILFGRNQIPKADRIRVVMGIRGEQSRPVNPRTGRVWMAIIAQVEEAGSKSQWVSVTDVLRAAFHRHPWSIGGGGAAELKESLEAATATRLDELTDSVGITSFTLEDDVFILSPAAALRHGLSAGYVRSMVEGDNIRDWNIAESDVAVFPYDLDLIPIPETPDDPRLRYLWRARTVLQNNLMFGGKTKVEAGLKWYEFGRLNTTKLRIPLSIAFAFQATHNHFAVDLGRHVFKQTAPVLKLRPTATLDNYIRLASDLNCSTACFWMKQTFFSRGGGGIGGGLASEEWEQFFEFDSTKLKRFPVVAPSVSGYGARLHDLACRIRELCPNAVVTGPVSERALSEAREQFERIHQEMIYVQEELDWEAYWRYGLLAAPLNAAFDQPLRNGERAFEIALARRVSAGEIETTWFERHTSNPITEVPEEWPEAYRNLVQLRLKAIETNPEVRLIEQPEYKRRWKMDPWEKQAERALRDWLLTRLEDSRNCSGVVISIAKLASRAASDPEFMAVAELFRRLKDFDVRSLVAELVTDDVVPALPIDRYKDSGLRKREAWEVTWELQRREDRGEDLGAIRVPPKYKSGDFRSSTYWSLRGKLDVPKERFISFPGCERESDPSMPILWAGFDHLKQAKAVAAYYQDLKDNEAAPPAKLGKLLASILELLPWLKQWHNEINPEYGTRMGDFFESFMHAEMAGLGLTMEDLRRIRGL